MSVLSDQAIQHRVATEGLIRGVAAASLLDDPRMRGAAFELTVARDGLVAPDSTKYEVGSDYPETTLILDVGQTAVLSSAEQLQLPFDLAGNLTIKTSMATRGLLLLSGVLVDPGYGQPAVPLVPLAPKPLSPSDGRLHFHVANVGTRPIPIILGQESVVAVQFLQLDAAVTKRRDVSPPATIKLPALSYLTQLRGLREDHEDLSQTVRRTEDVTKNVLVLGYFLLGATILGLTLNNLLAVGSDRNLVQNVNRAVPDSVEGKALVAILAIAFALLAQGLAGVFTARAQTPYTSLSDDDGLRAQARADLALRRRVRALCLVPVVTMTAVLTVLVFRSFSGPALEYGAPVVLSLVVVGIGWISVWLLRPYSRKDIDSRALKLNDSF